MPRHRAPRTRHTSGRSTGSTPPLPAGPGQLAHPRLARSEGSIPPVDWISSGIAQDDGYNSVLSGDSRLLSGLLIASGGFMPTHFALTRSPAPAEAMAIFRAAETAFSHALASWNR